ncbi:ubiquitin-specific protease ubp2 [Umbelopsis nana]
MPGQIGMFPLPPAQQQLLVYDSPKPNDNNDDTVSYTSTSTTVTEKRSKRSNSTASIASLAVAKYSSAVNVISNAVTPAALAATTALASLSPSRSNMNSPVGLNNIGNTCYLNSLLQYYFTLKSLREPVLDMDNYVEHEEAPDWQEKRIGGIKVGRVEVGQAKQFVALLRELFLNLTHAQESSIAPQERLAFMALTSADEIAKSSMNVNLKPLLESREDVHSTDVMAKTDLEGVPEEDQPMATDGQEDNSVATESTANGDVAVVNEINTTESNVMKVEADETVTSTEESAQPVAEQPVSVQSVLEKPVPEAPLASAQPVAHEDFSTETPYENEHQASQLRSFPSTETLATTGSQATINETVDVTPVPERGPVPLPLPYSASEGNGKVTESTNPFESSVRPQDPTKMLFGRQQDVTECMGNCMYFFEAALRPVASESSPDVKTDLVKELFYGKARQILTYNNQDTDQLVTKIKEEEFSHLIVDAAEGKNLYDGLDEYFFADKVDDFQGGNCAVREVAVTHFPPILQIQVQRVQFDRSSARVYKSNAFVQFDETIYLDRYLDRNFEILADRRKRVTESRKQLEAYKADIAELNENKKYPMPVAEMLEVTTKILTDNQENSKLTNEDYERVLHILHEEILAIKSRISDRETKIANIIHEIRTKYDDFQDCKYRLHAVFIHQGQANYGHYWIYIRDHVGRKWWKYNDTNVSEVNESEIFKDTTGSTANPYFLVYVKASDVQKHVMTVCRKKLSQ